MGNGYPTLPCAKPARGAGPGCHFGNPTQPAGGFLFCDRKKLPKMAVSSHFRPFCDRVLPGTVFGWQPAPPAGCQVGGLPEPKPGPTRPIAQPIDHAFSAPCYLIRPANYPILKPIQCSNYMVSTVE